MKERVNQLFKDKLVLVMLVLGLLTIVAAAGAVRIRKGAQNMEESPYLEIKEPEGMIAEETEPPRTVAGSSNAHEAEPAGAGAGSHVTENTLGAAETEAAALEDPPGRRGRSGGRGFSGSGFYGKRQAFVAGTGKCDPGIQHGHHHLVPDPGAV